jgi:hypothetical protein
MYCTIRRYEATDQNRTSEIVKKVDETLLPSLSTMPGFKAYDLVEAGHGVFTSVSFFDTPAQAEESARVVKAWVTEQKLEKALPNAPKVTSGEIVAHKSRELASV